MAFEAVTDEDEVVFMNPILSSKGHPLLETYIKAMSTCLFLPECTRIKYTLESDFTGVCLYLKVIECYITDYGETGLGFLDGREKVIVKNGKSDTLTKKFLKMCQKYCNKKELDKAIRAANKAYFSASSEDAKFDALKMRCHILLQMEYYAEFLQDAITCLEIKNSLMKKKVIYLLLSKFYNSRNYPEKSKFYAGKAYKNQMEMEELKNDIVVLRMEVNDLPNYEAKWKCIHPEPPESLRKLSKNIFENIGQKLKRDPFRVRREFLSARENLFQLIDTKSDKGWTIKVTKQVPVGEVLLTEKPYASVLCSQFTRYCYCCYRRCINIIPCEGCALVGFCSKKCAEDARSPYRSGYGGPGRHVYDCGGLIPCLRLDSVSEKATDRFEILPLSHLAYNCIANTPPEVLLDCICSTGRYKNFKHQAFAKYGNSRGDPPTFLDPSDYSLVASLYSNPITFDFGCRQSYFISAIFLTYCLWLAGYPMEWFGEAGGCFYKHPSEVAQRPNILPASWIAACMAYHMKSVRFNAMKYTELLESTKTQKSYYNWLAYCIYPTISFINHACNPNSCLVYTANGGAYLYPLRPLKSGEEISISYGYYYFSKLSIIQRRALLKERYEFECKCTGCVQFWVPYRSAEILVCSVCNWRYLCADKECAKKDCKKDGGYELFQEILNKKLPRISDCLKSKSCNMENVVDAVSLLHQAQELIVPPSPTVAEVTSTCMKVTDYVTGIRTVEDIQIYYPSHLVDQSIL